MVAVAVLEAALGEVLADQPWLRPTELILDLRVIRLLLRIVREVMVETNCTFVLAQFVEGRVDSIVGAALMLRKIGAAHT